MSPASVILMLLLILSRLSHQCNKAVVEHKDDHRDVIEDLEDDHKNNFDYDDVSATSDEDHNEEDDSGDAFQDAEDVEQLCAPGAARGGDIRHKEGGHKGAAGVSQYAQSDQESQE